MCNLTWDLASARGRAIPWEELQIEKERAIAQTIALKQKPRERVHDSLRRRRRSGGTSGKFISGSTSLSFSVPPPTFFFCGAQRAAARGGEGSQSKHAMSAQPAADRVRGEQPTFSLFCFPVKASKSTTTLFFPPRPLFFKGSVTPFHSFLPSPPLEGPFLGNQPLHAPPPPPPPFLCCFCCQVLPYFSPSSFFSIKTPFFSSLFVDKEAGGRGEGSRYFLIIPLYSLPLLLLPLRRFLVADCCLSCAYKEGGRGERDEQSCHKHRWALSMSKKEFDLF